MKYKNTKTILSTIIIGIIYILVLGLITQEWKIAIITSVFGVTTSILLKIHRD